MRHPSFPICAVPQNQTTSKNCKMLGNSFDPANQLKLPLISSRKSRIVSCFAVKLSKRNQNREQNRCIQSNGMRTELTSNASRRRMGSWLNPAWTGGLSWNRIETKRGEAERRGSIARTGGDETEIRRKSNRRLDLIELERERDRGLSSSSSSQFPSPFSDDE